MSHISQHSRSLGLQTSLGDDVLFIERITGKESLGNLFEYTVSAVAESDNFAINDLVGTDATVRMEVRRQGADTTRFFHGIISDLSHLGYDQQGNSKYELILVPWLWFLTQGTDCKIFQQKTLHDILQEVFQLIPGASYKVDLKAEYDVTEYCVQYEETHFNFIQRLLQKVGAYYYWEHTETSHTMVICDDMISHKPIAGFETVRYRANGSTVQEESYLSSWRMNQKVTPGRFTHNSYDFKAPKPMTNEKLLSRHINDHYHKHGNYEVYENSGDYLKTLEGENLAKIRRQELHTPTTIINSSTNARGLIVGHTFTPTQVPRQDQSDKELLIIATNFEASGGDFGSGTGTSEIGYSANITAIPYTNNVFRPERDARTPRMQGPQTAMVTGPEGEEIFVDEYGRVKVHFHWDRYTGYNAGSSCFVRVSQVWAGAGWGGMAIPRIGQEVIVDFIDGDPDRPIITGRVYNGENKTPYNLPADRTKTTIKSNTSPGGGGSNELRFEDKKDHEEVYIHAQKDQNNVVENDETTLVKHNRVETVGNDETIKIGDDRTEVVGDNEKVSIGNNQNLSVGKNQVETVGLNKAESIGIAKALSIGAAYQVSVGATMNTTVGVGMSEQVGAIKHTIVGKHMIFQCGASKFTMDSKGNITISGKKISLSAELLIDLKAELVDVN